jgi:hypothetical protein
VPQDEQIERQVAHDRHQHLVLHDVAHRAGSLVEPAAILDPNGFSDGDLAAAWLVGYRSARTRRAYADDYAACRSRAELQCGSLRECAEGNARWI